MGRKKKFSSDVMVYACEQHLTVGRPYLSIANELGIHQTTVRKWVYVYREHGSKAFANKGKNNSCQSTHQNSRQTKLRWRNRIPSHLFHSD